MNKGQFGKSLGSPVVLGCMRMAGMAKEDADKLIGKAMENGICSFDHADIYGGGESEKLFGQVLAERPELREGMFIQSKCGIRQGMYDLSEEYILNAVDGILERLRTDYLDLLILHRPDALMEPEEIAEAFERLTESGKVRRFGVSNMNAGQIALLQNWIHTDLLVDQMQLSLAHSLLVDEGINVNMADKPGEVHTGGTLDYCRLHRIAVQCWSPLQYGFFEGTCRRRVAPSDPGGGAGDRRHHEGGAGRGAVKSGSDPADPRGMVPALQKRRKQTSVRGSEQKAEERSFL